MRAELDLAATRRGMRAVDNCRRAGRSMRPAADPNLSRPLLVMRVPSKNDVRDKAGISDIFG